MKTLMKMSFAVLLSSFVFVVSAADKIKGESNTSMGKYVIEESDVAVNYKGKELKAYRLCYENCKKEVLIGVEKLEDCRNFVVVLDDMQIVYACEKGIFGVTKTPKQKSTSINVKEAIVRQQFYHQKVITQKPKTEKELLGLIACYYPALLKPGFLLQHS